MNEARHRNRQKENLIYDKEFPRSEKVSKLQIEWPFRPANSARRQLLHCKAFTCSCNDMNPQEGKREQYTEVREKETLKQWFIFKLEGIERA